MTEGKKMDGEHTQKALMEIAMKNYVWGGRNLRIIFADSWAAPKSEWSRSCRAEFGRPLTKRVMSHSRDGPGVTAPSRTNIVPLTGVWNPPLPLPPP